MKKRVLVLFAVMVMLLFAALITVWAEDGNVSWVSYSKTGSDWTYNSDFVLPGLDNGYTIWKCQIGDISIDLGTFNRPVKNENLVYNGQDQALITAESGTINPETEGVTAHYEYQTIKDNTSYECIVEANWSTDKPVASIPGTYTIWVRLVVEYNENKYYLGPKVGWDSLNVTIDKFTPSHDSNNDNVKVENFDVPTYAQLQESDFEWDTDFKVYIQINGNWILQVKGSAYTCNFYDPTKIAAGNSNIFYITFAESDCYNGATLYFSYHIEGNTLTVKTKLSASDLSYTGSAQALFTPFGFEDGVDIPIVYSAIWMPLDKDGKSYYEGDVSEIYEYVASYDNGVPLGTKAGYYYIYYELNDEKLDAAYEADYVRNVLSQNIKDSNKFVITVEDDEGEEFEVFQIYVKILPKELTAKDVTISVDQETTTVQWGEITLEQGTDYTVTSSFSEGTGNICINFNKEDYAGNYIGTINCDYKATGTETGITFVSDVENLVDTLTKATSGDLVILTDSIAQAEGCYLAVRSGVTLDLNGQSISGAELFYVTGTIKDTAS